MIFLDTSVLVAAVIEPHGHHDPSLKLFQNIIAGKDKAAISQHTLAELFSTLTNYPSNPRLTVEKAAHLIFEEIAPYFHVTELTPKDYRKAVARLAQKQLRGGVIYDALILQSALKSRSEALYTWNRSDFIRLSEKEIEILEP